MLAYQSEGNGTPVVLLHAFPLSSSMWERERKEIGRYAHVLTPDLPGFGASPRQKVPSISGMAESVGTLLDGLKIREPVVIGGLSMGGYVTFEFLRRFPERVRGLMLFSTRATPDTAEECAKRFRTIDDIQKMGFQAFAEKVHKKLLGRTSFESRPELVDKVMAMILAGKPGGAKDALAAMAERRDFSDLLSSIRCASLIAAGEEDEVIAPSEAQTMHQKIHASEFHKVPKAGHLVNLECPDTFGALVENFLATGVFERFGVAA